MRGYLSSIAPSSSNSWIELPQTLRDAGYYVGIAGKNHFGFNSTSSTFFDHGFQSLRLYEGLLENDPYDSSFQLIDTYDSFFNDSCPLCDPLATVTPDTWNSWLGAPYVYEEGLHPTSWTASAGIDFLSEWIESDSLSSMPFFLKLSFHRPHSPYDPPERWFDAMMAKSDQIQGPANGTTDSASAWDSVYTFSSNCNASHDECGGGCGTEAYCGGVNRSDFLYTRSLYHGSLSFVDEQFGRVLDWLETTKLSGAASSLLDNTFILYTSDHGDALGDHSESLFLYIPCPL
jgi:arylsulfatase A-like enzyme